jgi:hypothetical protein
MTLSGLLLRLFFTPLRLIIPCLLLVGASQTIDFSCHKLESMEAPAQ